MAKVKFLGFPHSDYYSASGYPELLEPWNKGETRECGPEAVAHLTECFPGAFAVTGKGAPKVTKAAKATKKG